MAETKILVAENHAGTARELRKALNELGYQLLAIVSRGERALASCSEQAPDLVLIEYNLPGNIEAVQIAEQIRAQGIPVIYILNQAEDKIFQRAGITQAFDYIIKPFSAREVNTAIEAALFRHRVVTKLKNYQDYYNYLHDANQILWDWNIPSEQITVNTYGASRLGLTADPSVIAIDEWYCKVHVEDVDIVRELITAHLNGETSHFEVEHRLMAAGSNWIWVYSRGKVVEKDSNKEPVRMLSTSREITYQKKAELEIQDSAHRLRVITQNMADIVGEIDGDGLISYISPSIHRTLGYSQDQVINMPITDFIHPDDMDVARENMSDSLRTLLNASLDIRVRHMDGRYIWVEATGKATQDDSENPKGIVFSLRDISQRRESDEALLALNERLTEWINELERRNLQTELLNEMGEWLQSCRNTGEAYSIAAQYVEKIFSDISGALFIRLPNENEFKAYATWGEFPPYELAFAPQDCWSLRRMRVHVATDPTAMLLCRHVIGFDHPHLDSIGTDEQAVLSDEILLQGRKFLPHICVPLIIQGEARGVIHLLVAEEQSIHNWEQLAITLAERISLALANLELQETLRYQAIRDPLTGLFNRRYMEETLSRELRRSVRFKRPLGVIMLDIDHFKQFNDDFSYAAGDLLLQALGNFLQDSLRHGDVICRYGGEEFVLILPEASLEDTHKRAEHIRTGVTSLQIQHRGVSLGTITISLGVVACPEHGEDPESILQAVDTALHKAKEAGRNHLVVADR